MTTEWVLFLIPILLGFLWAALQMTGSKLLGLVMMVFSLGSLWWLLEPTSTLLWGGWVAILALCGLYGWWIYEPPTAAMPHISSVNQSGGITGNYNTVTLNQALHVNNRITEPITTFHIEGSAVVLDLKYVPIPDSVCLKITTMTYNIYDSPGMTIQGRKVYLRNVEEEDNVRFFDYLPDFISERSVSVSYHRDFSSGEIGE